MFFNDNIEIEKNSVSITDEGYLTFSAAPIARAGIYKYLAKEIGITDKSPLEAVSVYRPPSEVFNDSSMQSFKLKPVTNNHSPKNLDSKTVRMHTVGTVGEGIFRDNDLLRCNLVVEDKSAIDAVQSGKKQLSCGYNADIILEKGISDNGEAYDAIMRNIRGNHIAIVTQGRAGGKCNLFDEKPNNKRDLTLVKVMFDGMPHEIAEESKALFDEMSGKFDENKKKYDVLKDKYENAEGASKEEKAKMMAELDTLKEKMKTTEENSGKKMQDYCN